MNGDNNPSTTERTENIESNQEPENQEIIRDVKGRFVPGQSGNPAGRPPGKSLKEYWKERFAAMTDQEKEEFSKKVSPELLWQMAEGRPSTKLEGDNDNPIVHKIIGINYIVPDGNNSTTDTKTTSGVSSPEEPLN